MRLPRGAFHFFSFQDFVLVIDLKNTKDIYLNTLQLKNKFKKEEQWNRDRVGIIQILKANLVTDTHNKIKLQIELINYRFFFKYLNLFIHVLI